jgi:hypothetical protein
VVVDEAHEFEAAVPHVGSALRDSPRPHVDLVGQDRVGVAFAPGWDELDVDDAPEFLRRGFPQVRQPLLDEALAQPLEVRDPGRFRILALTSESRPFAASVRIRAASVRALARPIVMP